MTNHTFKVERLLDLIRKNNLSKKDFCEAVNLSQTTLLNMQTRDNYDIGANRLAYIADYFSVSMDYFFDRDLSTVSIGHNVKGNGNNINGDILISQQASEIDHLKQMLDEKERTIQILLNKNA